MKKILLGFALIGVGLGTTRSMAQTVMTQNFEGVTIPALPASWITTGSTATGCPGWKTGSGSETLWASATGVSMPAHTQYAIIDQYKDTVSSPHNDNTYLHDTLKSPVFDMSAYTAANVSVGYDYFFFNATWNSTGQTESAYVLGSSDGGTTWHIVDTLWGYGWNGTWQTQHSSLSSMSGSNCMIAFTYADGGTAAGFASHLLGCALDNVSVSNYGADSVAVTGISYNSSTNGIATNGTPITFTVSNYSSEVTSLSMSYQVDALTPVTQNFTGLTIYPFGTATFTFSTPMSGAVSGTNTIKVKILQVNGAPNTDAADSLSSTFVLANAAYPRCPLVEEFTSSTCPPCMEFAYSFDPLCTALGFDNPTSGSDLNIIKYQMNWPDWNNDASYNSDGNLRRAYYACNSIPEHFLDGTVDNTGWGYPMTAAQDSAFSTEFTAAKQDSAFISLSALYYVDTTTHSLSVTVSATPSFTKTAAYHMYVAACDKHYKNYDNEWGMLNYYNVMREMFPNGSGTAISSFTAGTPVTYSNSAIAYTSVNSNSCTGLTDTAGLMPHMNSFTFWNNPLLNSELVVWVEQDANKSVMQSLVIPASVPVAVSTLSYVTGIRVFPNPAKDETNLRFNLAMAGKVDVRIIGYDGKEISSVVSEEMATGTQNVLIHTENIAAGNYIILIQTPTGTSAERLTVIK
jgi:Secretion system C-terminal sorting domain